MRAGRQGGCGADSRQFTELIVPVPLSRPLTPRVDQPRTHPREHPLIELQHYGEEHPEGFRDLLLDVHADAYRDRLDDPFVQRFPWFVDHWTKLPGFSCVVGYDSEGEPVGYAYGAPLAECFEWWRGHLEPAPQASSTYAVSEIMVRPRWRGQGLSDRLHCALLGQRGEDLAVLLVDTEHLKVRALYESWGYRKVGEQRSFKEAPLFAVMVRALREATGRQHLRRSA